MFQVAISHMIGLGKFLSVTSPLHEDDGVVSLCRPLVDQDFVQMARGLGFGSKIL